MSTGRELISQIRSINKLVSGDNTITDRAIYKELKNTAILLIKRETNLRRLWASPNLFTFIPCLGMEVVPLSECCDYQSDCMVARTKKKIPKISEGIFGLLIQSVFSPGMTKFDFASVDRFVNILKLGNKNTKKYFWIQDDRIYISNHNIENISVYAYFDEEFSAKDLSECQDKFTDDDTCVNPIDKPFPIPSYLEKNLIDMVNEVINRIYFQHIEDNTTDNKDTAR